MIPPFRRISSGEKRHQSKHNSSGFRQEKPFSGMLAEACEKEQQKDIYIVNHGYTKDALPLYHLVNMREYRHSN